MKVYTYDYANACVVERECEVFGYPHNDSSGAQQYVNTHFRTRLEAAEKLVSETQAGVSMCARRREDARARLDALLDVAGAHPFPADDESGRGNHVLAYPEFCRAIRRTKGGA